MDINNYLKKRADDLMVFAMPKNETLMSEIFKFDPRELELVSSADISRYAIGLSQFLIYFTSQINLSKVKLMQKKRLIENQLNQSTIKAKTKAERIIKLVQDNKELEQVVSDIEALECEIKMTENLEKHYLELINALKRELGRREVEYKLSKSARLL